MRIASKNDVRDRSARRGRLLLAATAGVAALGLVPVVAADAATPIATQPAPAATSLDAFYSAPAPVPSAPAGTLIRSRPLSIGGVTLPAYRAWSVMYHSRDSHGRDIPVTGAVLTPRSAWSGSGPRPFVSLGVGTQGLGPQCAPSKQLAAGSEYESGNIVAALARGWGVAVTDYEGYVNGGTPTYTDGRSEAHAVLDIVRTARHVSGAGASRTTPVGLWGYSQGGGAVGWAAALAPGYAPDVKVVGTAAGGVPSDLKAVGANLNGSLFGGLLGYSLVGFSQAYPGLARFDQVTNAQGKQVAAQLKTECVGDTAVKHPGLDVQDLTKQHLTYDQFAQLPGEAKILAMNNLATAAPAPKKAPVLQYHSLGDEVVPLTQALQLHRTWCAKGVKTAFMPPYPGEHLTGDSAGLPDAIAFLNGRFSNQPFVSTCPL
ncbi:MAG TPA: lipase family protein [Frankiaceae bacterium]|nr:lipase family protein [Frankiaceae bacterium]